MSRSGSDRRTAPVPKISSARLAYLSVTNVFALLRLLPASDRDKDVEILALRHQIMVMERQLAKTRLQFHPSDRAFMACGVPELVQST
jgi:hypothetical protein